MRKQTKFWRTKDGRKIRICDMEDGHLLNTLDFLCRYAKARHAHAFQEAMAMQSFFNPPSDTMAAYYLDNEMDQILNADWQDFLPEIYYDMCADAERRELLNK